MKITKYEIDMLEVGAADAFLLHFWDDETKYEYVILIDAGNYEDGKKVAKFIHEHYKKQYIDRGYIKFLTLPVTSPVQ